MAATTVANLRRRGAWRCTLSVTTPYPRGGREVGERVVTIPVARVAVVDQLHRDAVGAEQRDQAVEFGVVGGPPPAGRRPAAFLIADQVGAAEHGGEPLLAVGLIVHHPLRRSG
ncbi:hypothetical protein [Phytohabitans maris]|uniref:hypothetical protein n=1 Tax=Phytohabitans maris TaxID=3071409 RepID=UPI003D1768B2